MSDKIEATTTKLADRSAGINGTEIETQTGKRSRRDSFESLDLESPRKMRKQSSQRNISVKSEKNTKLDDTSLPKNDSSKISSNFVDDIGNDSALLNDLLADFDDDVSAFGEESMSSKQNSNSIKAQQQIPSNDKIDNATYDNDSTEKLLEFNDDLDGLFEEDFHENQDTLGDIDFQEFKYCKVLEIIRENKLMKLKVEQLAENNTTTVLCYGFWKEERIEVNDIVSIKAIKKSEIWTIDNEHGFLVTHPHTLVSGTSVVGAYFCIRRSILVESFRGLDNLPNLETGDPSMTIGTLVHEILQRVLGKKLSTIAEIRKVVSDILDSRRGIQMLYDTNLSLKECKQRIEPYIPKIFEFIKRYITGARVQDDNFSGKIERIREIEENVWVPELGLKGKIDVTVDVTVNINRKIMPLEVKTGQPSFSVEHKGQLMLYNMMLGFIGHQVDAGLLLYIRDNIVKEIKSNHPEERDLIMLRNSFAYYVSKLPEFEEVTKDDGSVEKVWKDTELPEPINHRIACGRCPYNILCASYAEKDPNLQLPESHVLKTIRNDISEILTSKHIDYVMHWIIMTKLEGMLSNNIPSLKDIWIMEPRDREKRGVCISNLRVCGKVEDENNRYLHTFVRKNPEENSSLAALSRTIFGDSDYIIVSTNTRINVSSGYVKMQNTDKIQLLLDRNITKQNPMATFHLDKWPSSGIAKLNLSNIACLLNNHEITNKLRGIIIDQKPTTFTDKLPRSVAEKGAKILHLLNKYQRHAILKVMMANDYLLIKGMPGTGKTQTLVALIELLVNMGQTVLVTAHTHSAVDNILLKLDEKGIDFLRLGSSKRLDPKIKHKSEDFLTAECTSAEHMNELYNSKNIVGVTCCGSIHGLLSKRIFDVCLVDESTQVLQSTVLKPIFSAKKFILVGDPEQLPPVIRNNSARKMGMDESLFIRLDNNNNTVTLKMQYRMNRKIMTVANAMTYKGAMKTANEEVANATLRLTDTMILESCEKWVAKALSLDLEDSVVMLNTGQTYLLQQKFYHGDQFNFDNKRVHNILEGNIVMRIVAVLLKGGISAKSIGVISPYSTQVELLRNICQDEIEINTVDQYQGRDKEVILLSCTRSEPTTSGDPSEYEVLQDRKRLNVAVTRAKHKLIIIGDQISLDRYAPFKKLFRIIKDDIINLKPERDNFSWEQLVEIKQ